MNNNKFPFFLVVSAFFIWFNLFEPSFVHVDKIKERKLVVITGTSSGLGKEFARFLSTYKEDEFYVLAGVRKLSDFDLAAINNNGKKNIHPIALDVTSERDIQAAVQTAQTLLREDKSLRFGGIVNNAGVLFPGAFEHVDLEMKFQKTLDVHLLGTVRMIKYFMPLFQNGTRIVNIGSLAAILSPVCNAAYNVAKNGMWSLSVSLRQELKHKNVGVSHIVCGETRGTSLHKFVTKNEFRNGYEHFYKTFVVGAKWLGNSAIGTTLEDLDEALLHALTSEHPKREYYVPRVIRFFNYIPRFMIESLMESPPPDFLL